VRPRSLLVLALVLVACGVASTQQPLPAPYQPTPPVVPAIAPQIIPAEPLPIPAPAQAAAPAPAESLEQMLDRLESLQAKQAELKWAEQELVKQIRQKADKQFERLNKLGVTRPAVPPPPVSKSSDPVTAVGAPLPPADPAR
jgi:hypothetical protein